MSPLGLGNDIGGSLRNPAYCCGITSLKPTTGRIPSVHSMPTPVQSISSRLMAVEGPMARSVADLKIALQILSGWHPGDPFSVSAQLEGPPAAKKAALVTRMPFSTLPAASVAAIHRAGDLLRELGWAVEEVAPPELGRVNEIWGFVLGADLKNNLPLMSPMMSEAVVGSLHSLLRHYDPATMTATEIYNERDRLALTWSEFLGDYPIIIGPIWADLPFPHDADLDPQTGLETTLQRLQFITPANLLGIPAVALPMGVTDGLPTGIQIYAERWREDVCLSTAEAIEATVGAVAPIDPRDARAF